MKRPLIIILTVATAILVVLSVVSDQQLQNYAKQNQVVAQMSAAGPDGEEAACRSFHLPWFARQFDLVTPAAFIALLVLAGTLVWRKKLELSKTVLRFALSVLIIGFVIFIIYQIADPFYPFAMCRGWLP